MEKPLGHPKEAIGCLSGEKTAQHGIQFYRKSHQKPATYRLGRQPVSRYTIAFAK
jgi:hypothetical protein